MKDIFNMFKFTRTLSMVSLCAIAHIQAAEQQTFDSMTIQGVLSPAHQQRVYAPLQGGIPAATAAFKKLPNSVVYAPGLRPQPGQYQNYLFVSKPESYHFTACIIEPTDADKAIGQKLTADFHGTLLEQACKDSLQSSYQASVYQFQLWAHGYDRQGNEITKYYPNAAALEGNKLATDFPHGIAKLDCVHRVGTSTVVPGQPTQAGPLRTDIENNLIQNINKLSDIVKNPYQGKYDTLVGHLTAATMKKQLKGVITAASPRFMPSEYPALKATYTALQTNWRQNNNAVYNGKPLTITFRVSGREIVNGKAQDTVVAHIG